jgi:hypothetical protein
LRPIREAHQNEALSWTGVESSHSLSPTQISEDNSMSPMENTCKNIIPNFL